MTPFKGFGELIEPKDLKSYSHVGKAIEDMTPEEVRQSKKAFDDAIYYHEKTGRPLRTVKNGHWFNEKLFLTLLRNS